MIEVKKSINIKYDSNNKKILDDYFATSSHSEIINKVIQGVLGGNNRAHIAFGPYGAGKSFISSILIGFTMKNYEKNKVHLFRQKFDNVDVKSSDLFKRVYENDIEYIPVLINGYEGKFDKTLIRSLKQQLINNGIEVFDRKPSVESIIKNWKEKFKAGYDEFLKFLKDNQLTEEIFLETINNDQLFEKFSTFYERITAGAKINSNESMDLITSFEKAANALESLNKGIILVYDEFGRMLQNIDASELNRFMQQLQDLAELANNSCKNLSLLFIAHKPISHYFSYLDKETRSEFSKIEKRFSVTSIQSDHATFVNIASQVIKKYNLPKIEKIEAKRLSKYTNKYKLFSDNFNQTEIDNLIIRDSYPIHPVSMFLLPMISRVFGQNERTLFSFLSDTSHNGLINHISNRPDKLYFPDQLADYFFLNSDVEIESKEVDILRKNIGFINSVIDIPYKELSERIYKLIAVWGITNANNYVSLNDEFVAFSVGTSKEIAEKILDELAIIKLIRYDREKKYWYIIESNSIDIDAEIKSKNMYITKNPDLITETLNNHNPFKYIYPNEHNSKYEITRFALVNINLKDYPKMQTQNSNHDFLYECYVNCSPTGSGQDMTSTISFDQDKLVDSLTRLTVVDSLLKDKVFLHNFKNASVDLEYEKNRVLSELNLFYKLLFKTKIKFSNQEINIKSKGHLSEVLSNYADAVYDKTLFIRNDQINMFVITTQQLNATLKVINEIIENETFDLDNIFNSSKPEDLIYYSLKITSESNQFTELKKLIIEHLDNYSSGKFSDLIAIATQPPFGIRPTLSGLIILIAIVERYSNMLFTRDGNYISNLNAKQIYDAGLGINDFEYTYSNFDFEHKDWMTFILNTFPNPSDQVEKKSTSIKVLSALLIWFNALPVIIQQGDSIGIQDKYFLRTIEKSKTNPLDALKELVMYETSEISNLKINIEKAYEIYLDAIESNLKNEFGIASWLDWSKSVDIIKRKTNDLVRLSFNSANIIREYAKLIDTIEIERWTKGSYEKMVALIRTDFLDASDKMDTFTVDINGVKKEVQDIVIGNKAKNLKRNLSSMIDANLRYITSSEVEKLLVELIERYIK